MAKKEEVTKVDSKTFLKFLEATLSNATRRKESERKEKS